MLELLSQVWYILCGILLLGILVAVHEFGHFMAARLTGIEVMEFSIGMGPKIISRTSKKTGTKFSLRWIPFGGFCAFYGEDDVEGKSADDPRAYSKQAAWKRMLTVAMGPVMNFLLAFAAAVIFCWCSGVTMAYPVIGDVNEGGPAAVGGVLPGDVVLTVNGQSVSAPVEDVMGASAMDRLDGFRELVASAPNGAPLKMTVMRFSGTSAEDMTTEEVELTVTARWNETEGKSLIGISYGMGVLSAERTRLGFLEGIEHAWVMCVDAGTAVFDVLGKLFTDAEVRSQVSGPVGVIDQTSQIVKVGGTSSFINLIVLISVNLGLMNLLPIPGLDGARFIFHTVEAITRKPIRQDIEAAIHLVGTLLLLLFLLLVTGRDVFRLF